MATRTYFACVEIHRMKPDGSQIDDNAPKICFKVSHFLCHLIIDGQKKIFDSFCIERWTTF